MILEGLQQKTLFGKLITGFGSLVLLIVLIALAFLSFNSTFSGYADIEKQTSKGVKKDFSTLIGLSSTIDGQVGVIKQHVGATTETLNQTAEAIVQAEETMSSSEALIEQFEFIGTANSNLIKILLEPENTKLVNLTVQMINSWNNTFVKNDPELEEYYLEIKTSVSRLAYSRDTEIFSSIQSSFSEIYSIMIERIYDSTGSTSESLDSASSRFSSIEEKLGKSVTSLTEITASIQNNSASLKKTIKNFGQIADARESAQAKSMIIIAILICVMTIALIVAVVIFRVLRKFGTDAETVKNYLSKVGGGILSVEHELQLDRNKSDELMIVSQFINAFVEKMKITIQNAQKTTSGILELNKSVASMEKGMHDVYGAISKNTGLGESVARGIDSSIEDAKESQGKIIEGQHGLQKTSKNVDHLIKELNESVSIQAELNSRLTQLSNDILQIKDVLGLIKDISEQTNLLALNASIEAARAGEHGRGFSVVADEVRNLAERTGKSLVEIEGTINTVVDGISNVSDSMVKTSSQMEQLSKEGEISQSNINDVSSSIGVVVELNEKSTNESIELGSATKEIISGMQDVSLLLQDTLNIITEVGEHSRELEEADRIMNKALAD